MISPDELLQRALDAFSRRHIDEAERHFRTLLEMQPDHVAALNLLTVVLMSKERFAEAERFIARAVKLNQNSDVSYYNYGLISIKLNKPEQALEQFEKALELNPKVAETWNNRGTVLNNLKQHERAIADFDQAISLNPSYAGAFCNRGKALAALGRCSDALAAYECALGLEPDFAEAWVGRGALLHKLKRYDEALAACDRASALKPNLAEAWYERGHVFNALNRHDQAFAAYDKAFALKPELVGVEGARLYSRIHLCDWRDYAAETTHLIRRVRSGESVASPFLLLGIPSTAQDQLMCARLCSTALRAATATRQHEKYRHDRIRIAYVSGDFRDHPVAYLMAGVFEGHDDKRFETFALSFGSSAPGAMRARLEKAFERFIDVGERSDADAAHLMRTLEIDIAVDLMGYTAGCRPGIFSYRPAPIQVGYLGYAGTTGASYIDYLIADHTVVPPEHRDHYSEKIVYLPNSFMPNDVSTRLVAERTPDRGEFGLPQAGFVFCAFNNTYKLNPEIFDSWAKILKSVEGSVLWLSAFNVTAVANLTREMDARGVDPKRLVFAGRLPSLADHLARHRLADLYLDTLPYNAHASASDALWAGLPVLTQVGDTFAGRVGASLLSAIGLPELIVKARSDYEKAAVDLARDSEKLKLIRDKLARNRLTTALFDIHSVTRHIEEAYTAMYERLQSGMPPDHIQVPGQAFEAEYPRR